MPKFNFKKSVFRPVSNAIKNTARPLINQGLNELRTQGIDALRNFGTTALADLEATAPILAFKNGGKVPGAKNRAKMAVVHGGEYVLPVGVKPTVAQKKAVAKKKAKAKK
jgi:hypothetical protein